MEEVGEVEAEAATARTTTGTVAGATTTAGKLAVVSSSGDRGVDSGFVRLVWAGASSRARCAPFDVVRVGL